MKHSALGVITLVGLLGIVGYLKKEDISNLQATVTLFDEDTIVSNFINMADIFPTKKLVSGTEPFYFSKSDVELPKAFRYKGNVLSTEEYLNRTATTSLVVLKGDNITYESYRLGTELDDKRVSWSVAKSFMSAMFGIAVHNGDIESINDSVTKYVPSLKGSGYDGVTIKNVLQMSSGVRFDENYDDFFSDINRMGRLLALGGSFDEFASSLSNERLQGEYLHYVSIDTHVLGMVLREATGETITDYFKKNLWSKIHPESDAYYITDETGEPMVLGGLNMISRDYLKFGKLYRDGGYWEGEQVVPENWVFDSTFPDLPHLVPGSRDNSDLDLGYGYQWWFPVGADSEFMAIGIYDQFIYVNRKENVVIVKTSANTHFTENNYDSAYETTEFFRAVTGSLRDNASIEQVKIN